MSVNGVFFCDSRRLGVLVVEGCREGRTAGGNSRDKPKFVESPPKFMIFGASTLSPRESRVDAILPGVEAQLLVKFAVCHWPPQRSQTWGAVDVC